jgi:hypothetical protein
LPLHKQSLINKTELQKQHLKTHHSLLGFSNQEIINGNTTVIDALMELGLSAENISALQSELQLSFNSHSAVDIVATTNGMFTIQGTSLKPLNCWPGNGAAAVMSSSGPGTMISKFSLSVGSPNPVLANDYCPDMFGCTYYHDVQPGAPYIIVYSHQAEHPSLINHSAWCL